MSRCKFSLTKQHGVGLIEALIALLVISVGLLGVAAMQITSIKQSSSAMWHSQAVWYSYEITDRISANSSEFDTYSGIDTDNNYDQDCQGSPCTSDKMVVADAQDWTNQVRNLPNGRGLITGSNPVNSTLQVTVMWQEDGGESNCTGIPNSADMTCYTVTILE